ncbi:putative transcription factor TIFY family [Dioscorea sansibarensis]
MNMKNIIGGGGDEPELELRLGSPEPSPKPNSGGGSYMNIEDRSNQEGQLQQMTIFYAGHVCVSEVTHIQAKAIICMAKGIALREEGEEEEEEVHQKERAKEMLILSPKQQQQQQPKQNYNNNNNNQYHALPQQVLSMKGSLQRFLQKRKTRIDSSSPYCFLKHHSLPTLRSS